MKAHLWKVMAICGAVAGVAHAAPIKFVFEPAHFLDLYSTDTTQNRADQENPRVLVDARAPAAVAVAGTYNLGLTQPDALNTYENWLQSLGPEEGIWAFNMWVTTAGYPNNAYDGNPSNPWNQEIFRDGSLGNSAAGISATAGAGWNAAVVDIYLDTYGVQWWTDDPAAFLRPGFDPGAFSFTMEDTNAQVGQDYRVWFGSASLVFDDQNWGTLEPAAAPFSSLLDDNNSRWNGIALARATSVPDLGVTALMAAMGMAALAAVRRKLP